MEHTFIISGLCPVYGKKVGELPSIPGFCINDVYIKKEIILITGNSTEEELDRQPNDMKEAYEKIGWLDVVVKTEIK